MKQPIQFSPESELYEIGTIVSPKIDTENKFIILGYIVDAVDNNGFVTFYRYNARGSDGYFIFDPIEITECLVYKNNN